MEDAERRKVGRPSFVLGTRSPGLQVGVTLRVDSVLLTHQQLVLEQMRREAVFLWMFCTNNNSLPVRPERRIGVTLSRPRPTTSEPPGRKQ